MRRAVFFSLFVLGCSSKEQSTPVAPIEDSAVAIVDSFVADTTADTYVATDTPTVAKTVIRVHYPAGSKTVSLRGSIAPRTWEKGVAMTSGGEDTWTLETTTLTVEAEWKPLLDDTSWSRGPNYKIKPGTTLDVYPHFVTTNGKVENKWPAFASTALGNTRNVWVYYPPTYLENARARFPVVYMHDAQNLFDPAKAFGGNEWKVDETLDAAAESGAFREAIVVAPENTSQRIYEYTPTSDPDYTPSGGGDKYLKMLVEELKPRVDAELRTLPSRENTVILGSSLGGLISAYAGTTSTNTFGLIGAMSPSTWWDSKVIIGKVTATKDATPRPLRVYIDSGDSGSSSDDKDNTKLLSDAYAGIGFVEGTTLKYVVQPGATHSEVYWAQRLPGAFGFLLGAR
jgi:predicted alpha/beta superfamily hydrolase